ncbi:exported hypothetical protein [Candidatus Desulfosporosinus infrequens]|uniref:Bacterial Ig-like domain-containing protein n=1 Tax=Candidatus Desulfosporosinus infrequens TaxID=2043169 RepID=A0A2U3L523_9FIRM|nr:exported hypothetical protein [Candidatus Desulfosporosinus infrequens]
MTMLKISKVITTFLISLMMMTILLCYSTPVQAAQDGDFTYAITNDQAQITSYTGAGGAVTIPSTLGGFPVTSIGNSAFDEFWALGIDTITSISIPQGVTSIGDYAFYCCGDLTSINIPQGVTSMGNYAFFRCNSLTSISLPQGLISIGGFAFYGCDSLTSLSIPQRVSSIGDFAFAWCSGLTAFTVAVDNSKYASINGVLFNKTGTNLIEWPGGLTGNISIPPGVTSIGNDAFVGCTGITSISIPQGVTSIGDGAFTNCTGLKSISMPQGITSIGDGAFSYCTGLTSISIPQEVTSIGDGAFTNCTGLTGICIPQGVTSISDGVFTNCTGLTSISIPKGVISIGNYSFSGCTGINSISIPQGVTIIGASAFGWCTGLDSITFNSPTTIISDYGNGAAIPVTTTIIGFAPSTAKDYATKYNIKFEAIDASSTQQGNIPVGTVIFGNGQALDLGYANNSAHTAEVIQDVVGGGIYVITSAGQVINNNTGAILTDLSALPAVTYKDANGNVKHFASADGPEIDGSSGTTATVSSVAPVSVNTTALVSPVLPVTVTAVMSDGTTQNVAVNWMYISPSLYANAQVFTETGIITNSTVKATAIVTVKIPVLLP